MGTMCESVLEYIKKEKAHKQVVLVINKCDLVPNWVTVSNDHPDFSVIPQFMIRLVTSNTSPPDTLPSLSMPHRTTASGRAP